MPWLQIVLGALALIGGRQLFWFFVGVVGFRAGLLVGAWLAPQGPDWTVLLIALAFGVLGALLTVVLQQVVIGLAGFVAGGEIAVDMLHLYAANPEPMLWVVFIVGGAIGLVLVLLLFDWALIVLSSFVGAGLVVRGLALSPDAESLMFIALFAAGFIVQGVLLRRSRQPVRT